VFASSHIASQGAVCDGMITSARAFGEVMGFSAQLIGNIGRFLWRFNRASARLELSCLSKYIPLITFPPEDSVCKGLLVLRKLPYLHSKIIAYSL
jgi:hypothetical protein